MSEKISLVQISGTVVEHWRAQLTERGLGPNNENIYVFPSQLHK